MGDTTVLGVILTWVAQAIEAIGLHQEWEGLWGVHSGKEGAAVRRQALQKMGAENQ